MNFHCTYQAVLFLQVSQVYVCLPCVKPGSGYFLGWASNIVAHGSYMHSDPLALEEARRRRRRRRRRRVRRCEHQSPSVFLPRLGNLVVGPRASFTLSLDRLLGFILKICLLMG